MAVTLTQFFDSLTKFGKTVKGIQNSYGLDGIPNKLVGTAQFPVLVIVPEVGNEQGLSTLTMLGQSPALKIDATHMLLYASAENDAGAKRDLPGLIKMADAYVVAAKTSPLLTVGSNPTYQVPIQFQIDIGVTKYGDVDYHSVLFKHSYTLYL